MVKYKTFFLMVKNLQLETKLFILCLLSIFFTSYVSGVVCFFVALTFVLRKNTRKMLFRSTGFIPVSILCAIGILASILTKNLLIGLAGTVCVMIPMFIVYLTGQNLLNKDSSLVLFRSVHVFSLLAAVFAFCQFFFFQNLHDRRPYSVFHNPNLYANIICLISILSIALILTRYDKKFTPVYILTLVLNLPALYLTGCRTVWPALACAVLIMTLLLHRYKIAIVLSALLIIAALCIYLGADLVPRQFLIEEDIHVRFDIIKKAFDGIKERPLLGGGIFYFNMYSADFVGNPLHKVYMHTHNLLINFIFDFGLLGFSFLTVFFIQIIRKISKAFRQGCILECSVAFGAMISTLIHGTLDVTAFNVQTGQLFLMLMAVAIASGRLISGHSEIHVPSPDKKESPSFEDAK